MSAGFATTPIVSGPEYETALALGLEAAEEFFAATDPVPCLTRRWRQVAELGWFGIAIPEAAGGAGGELADLAALAGGVGRAGLPLPIALACGVVPALLVGHPMLAAVASGAARIAAILPGVAGEEPTAHGFLSGAVVGVESPPAPTHLLIAVDQPDPVLLLLHADAPGITSEIYQRIDYRLSADWRFAAVAIQPGWIVARGAAVLARAAAARDLGALLTAVECVAAMGALIEQTIQYLLHRQQFGAPLASYQALRHRVADMLVEYENLRGITARALRLTAEGGDDAWAAIAFAKLRLGEVGRAVAESAIQCHGGMGMTEELPAMRLCKRLMMAEFEYGNRVFQASRLLAA